MRTRILLRTLPTGAALCVLATFTSATPSATVACRPKGVSASVSASRDATEAVVCTYNPLSSGVSVMVPGEGFYSFDQTQTAWTAVAVRPAAGSDWDLFAYSQTAIDPACVSGDLASSFRVTGADVVVGDFHHNLPATYYVGPTRPGGSGPGFLEWDNGTETIVVDAAPVVRTASAGDIVEIWDVALQAGQTYTIAFERSGAADVRALLFRNPGTTYWAARDNRVLEIVAPEAFMAPATDIYAIAVVNDDGGDGVYELAVLNGLVASPHPDAPKVTALQAIAPNPAREKASVVFDLAAAGTVRFDVVDVAGRIVASTEERAYGSGRWSQPLATGSLAAGVRSPGVYFVRMIVNDHRYPAQRFIQLQ